MKKQILLLIAIVTGFTGFSQQEYTYTFFGNNLSFFNPAATGTKDKSILNGSFRKQWVGLDGTPTSGGLTYELPLKKYNMGVGAMINQDHVGVTNQSNVAGLYSYSIRLDRTQRLAFGVNAGIDLINTKNSRLTYWDENDAIFSEDYINLIVPHIGVGIHYYTDKLNIGVSVPRIISTNSNQFNSIDYKDVPSLVTHYYLTAGYNFMINSDFDLKSNLLFKYTNNVIPQGDLSVIAYYKNLFGLGVAYKSFGFVSAILQYNNHDALIFGYAFDFSLGPIQNYTKGSHEILIQYRFDTPKNNKKSAASFD